MAAQAMNLMTEKGRSAFRSSALVVSAVDTLLGNSDMATNLNGRNYSAAAQAAALCQPSYSLCPTLIERHESISLPFAGFGRGDDQQGYPSHGNGSSSIRGASPHAAGVT